MRHKSGLIALAIGVSAAAPACAQALVSAAKSSNPLTAAAFGAAPATTGEGVRLAPAPRTLNTEHPFRPPAFAPQRGFGAWQAEEVTVGAGHGAVDTMRLAVKEERIGPSAGIVSNAPYASSAVSLSYTRGWPDALQLNTGRFDLAVSPHAGVGVSSMGTSAEAGAMVKLSSGGKSVEDRLGDLVSDGKKYGDKGRWYLFAAASGRSVGLNMTRTEEGWGQSGWSTDKTSKLVGDGQLGVGFRKGAMQASFGYVYREIKVQNGPLGADTDVSDSMAAFSLSIKPNF